MALTIEQWQEVRDVLAEVEANLQDGGSSDVVVVAAIKEIRDSLKPMVYTEEYRQALIAFIKQADVTYGLNIETDDDGQLVIYTGLAFPSTDQAEEIQTFDNLQLMEDEEE
jgi:hypothetical protein